MDFVRSNLAVGRSICVWSLQELARPWPVLKVFFANCSDDDWLIEEVLHEGGLPAHCVQPAALSQEAMGQKWGHGKRHEKEAGSSQRTKRE